ncbi:MAG: hypothetical protein IK082_03605 [Oscillospiraceae bacterium]|nr:hypothetical protein [Oscillospiraceae bacterium]
MSSVAIYLIIMLAAAAGIAVVCVAAYNRRMDRITSGELRDTHNSIPEPKTTVGVLYRVVLMAVVVLALFSISAANGRLSSLQDKVNQLQSDQSRLVDEIYDLQQKLEQDRFLVANSWWGYEGVDFDARTVEVAYTVALKQYSEDTTVTLDVNGKAVPLEAGTSGSFTGRFTAGLFEDLSQAMLHVVENGTTKGESADLPEYVFWDFLPMPSLSSEFESGMPLGKMKYSGSYAVLTDQPEEIEAAAVTYLSGGRELKTLDITEAVRNRETITLEKGLDLEKDLTFRIELVTKTGFRIVQQTVMIYESSVDIESQEYLRILDGDGSIVWEDGYR